MDNRAHQQVDGTGFSFDGVRYQGFPDLPTDPKVVREQVARWAVAYGVAKGPQLKLARAARGAPPRSELLETAQIEDAFLDLPVFECLLQQLNEDEHLRLLRPEGFLGKLCAWPMTPGVVESLFPELTANKLRDWDNRGLIQAYRWGTGRYRGYFRTQIVVALLVSKLLAAGWTIDLLTQELAFAPNSERETIDALRDYRKSTESGRR